MYNSAPDSMCEGKSNVPLINKSFMNRKIRPIYVIIVIMNNVGWSHGKYKIQVNVYTCIIVHKPGKFLL